MLNFDKRLKTKVVGVRFTDEEFEAIEKIACTNKVSIGAACHVIIVAALEELKQKKIRQSGGSSK